MAPKSETIPLRTEVAYEPRGLRTKRPSPNGGLGKGGGTGGGGAGGGTCPKKFPTP